MVGVPKSTGRCRLLLVHSRCNKIRLHGMSEAKSKGMPRMVSQHYACLTNRSSAMRRGRNAPIVERSVKYAQDLLLDILSKTLGLNWTVQSRKMKEISVHYPNIKVRSLTRINARLIPNLGLQKTHLSCLKKWDDTGAVVLKFRLSSTQDEQKRNERPSNGLSTAAHALGLPTSQLYDPFSAFPHDGLARRLVKAMENDDAGYSISDFGSFMQEVPRRVGHNAALDAAVTCLIHTRSAMITIKALNNLETPKHYLAAVQKLQHCLEDRIDGMSPNTLCAAVLLSLVEVSTKYIISLASSMLISLKALAGPRLGNSYLAHVGGAGRLLEIQGPQTCKDNFAKEILRFARGGIVSAEASNRCLSCTALKADDVDR
jgi:hypothetical protein